MGPISFTHRIARLILGGEIGSPHAMGDGPSMACGSTPFLTP